MGFREKPGPGQESVWDYPRPPRVESVVELLRVVDKEVQIAHSNTGFRVLETSHPPVYYIPQEDIQMQYLVRSPRGGSFCEWKGMAEYWDLVVGARRIQQVAWSYPHPNKNYSKIEDHLAFYPGKVKACYVGHELVKPQAGGFYGGWITSQVVGPFKGASGTWGW